MLWSCEVSWIEVVLLVAFVCPILQRSAYLHHLYEQLKDFDRSR